MDLRPPPPGRRGKRQPTKKPDVYVENVIEIPNTLSQNPVDNVEDSLKDSSSREDSRVETDDQFDESIAKVFISTPSDQVQVFLTPSDEILSIDEASTDERSTITVDITSDQILTPLKDESGYDESEIKNGISLQSQETNVKKELSFEHPAQDTTNYEQPVITTSTQTKADEEIKVQTEQMNPTGAEYYGLERLLIPYTTVPEIDPLETLECIYNNEAIQLQKQILRAVKHATKNDKLKLEEFKISSRLYGNGFIDPQEYIQSMAKELGPLNMLVIVPPMLRLQPDPLMKNSLYVALQTYRTNAISMLERLCN